MKLLKFWLPTVMLAVSLTTSAAYASCDCGGDCNDIDQRDFDAVTDFINSKRSIPLQEKACNFTISGDVRAEWKYDHNYLNGNRVRGGKNIAAGRSTNCKGSTNPVNPIGGSPTGYRIATNEFDVELNLYFDYKCDRSWAVAHLQFDNDMGIITHKQKSDACGANECANAASCSHTDDYGAFGSGQCNNICLKRAYYGYNLCVSGTSRLDLEFGRRRFYDVFDSRIEFNAQFDGFLFRYGTQLDCCADAYINFAGFVIDERSKHFGWAMEAGVLNLYDSGVDFKYSYIDWLQKSRNVANIRNAPGWDFQVHQFLGYYHLNDELLCMPAKAYGAVLWNSHAKGHSFTDGHKRNLGFYAGALFGEVCHEGDFSFDINYQYVQAQAIPDADVSGIGRDNVLCETLTQGVQPLPPTNARGNANFKGVRMEALYALTEDLSLDAVAKFARSTDKNMGGKLNYSEFKLTAIYAF